MFDEPMANSSRLVLPTMTAPAFHRLAVTVLSYCGTKPSRMCEPAVVCTPSVQNRSLMASGTPSSRPASPLARRASEALAISRARSGVSVMKALSARCSSSFLRCASATSTALASFLSSVALSWASVRSVRAAIAYSTTLGTVKKPPAFLSVGSM